MQIFSFLKRQISSNISDEILHYKFYGKFQSKGIPAWPYKFLKIKVRGGHFMAQLPAAQGMA